MHVACMCSSARTNAWAAVVVAYAAGGGGARGIRWHARVFRLLQRGVSLRRRLLGIRQKDAWCAVARRRQLWSKRVPLDQDLPVAVGALHLAHKQHTLRW